MMEDQRILPFGPMRIRYTFIDSPLQMPHIWFILWPKVDLMSDLQFFLLASLYFICFYMGLTLKLSKFNFIMLIHASSVFTYSIDSYVYPNSTGTDWDEFNLTLLVFKLIVS